MRVRLALTLALAALASAVLLAFQDQAAPILDTGNLSSTAGIVTASIFVTYLAKRNLAMAPGLQSVPVWIYVVVISAGLTYLANAVFGTLPGDLKTLTGEVVKNALLAIGTRELVYNADKPLRRSSLAERVKREAEFK